MQDGRAKRGGGGGIDQRRRIRAGERAAQKGNRRQAVPQAGLALGIGDVDLGFLLGLFIGRAQGDAPARLAQACGQKGAARRIVGHQDQQQPVGGPGRRGMGGHDDRIFRRGYARRQPCRAAGQQPRQVFPLGLVAAGHRRLLVKRAGQQDAVGGHAGLAEPGFMLSVGHQDRPEPPQRAARNPAGQGVAQHEQRQLALRRLGNQRAGHGRGRQKAKIGPPRIEKRPHLRGAITAQIGDKDIGAGQIGAIGGDAGDHDADRVILFAEGLNQNRYRAGRTRARRVDPDKIAGRP